MSDDANMLLRLGDAASAAAGFPLRGSAEALPPGDIRLVQLKHVSLEEGVRWDEVPVVELPVTRRISWLSDQDVLFASRGTRTLAYPLVHTPLRAVCAPQFFVISVNDTSQLLPEFLAWQMNQRAAQDYFHANATGSFIQNIRREVVEGLPITVPPLEQQRLVVDLWRTAQRERAVLKQLIDIRDKQLGAIALRLFQPSTGDNA